MTLKHYAMARETRMILGVLLLLFSVIALLAYLSFLFTGTADQSVLSQAYEDQVANRHEIRNILGLPGARLARFLIDGSFGFVSILMVLMCGTYALRIMHVLKDIKAIKIFCTTAFWCFGVPSCWVLFSNWPISAPSDGAVASAMQQP